MKERLDSLVMRKGWAESKEEAARLILEGKIRVNFLVRTDPAMRAEFDKVSRDTSIQKSRFASRGGLKLEGALDFFSLEVTGAKLVDLGASTGGFTDCLLQRGARSIIAVDVGRGLLEDRLRKDPRVCLIESANVRYPGDWMPVDPVDGVVVDLSFIALRHVLPQVAALVREGGWLLALVKPQFEAPSEWVARGGVVRDPAYRQQVLRRFLQDLLQNGGYPLGIVPSDLRGRKGNQEYFCFARWKGRH